jgi:phosphoribosyl 1,2-cyclic phosphate phosphodiesterase
MGLDEVRRFNVIQQQAIPAYADPRTAEDLRRTFAYVFDPPREKGGGIPQIELRPIDGPFAFAGLRIVPVPLLHGRRPILGFRLGAFAYLTDCNAIPEASWPLLEGLDVMVLDALRHRAHPTHFSVSEALRVVEKLRPKQTYFTHICHDLAHAETNRSLPPRVALAYDGLVLDIGLASGS